MTATALHTLDFGGEVVSFSIERTARRKTVSLSVGYDGVRVFAPTDLDDNRILSIVRQKGAWVLRKQAGYRELGCAQIAREFVSGETFQYLGRPYRLKVISDTQTVVTRIVARGSSLIAPVPSTTNPMIRRAAVRSGLQQWYRDHAKQHFLVRTKAMATLAGAPMPPVHVVEQSKRWGSCGANGHIRLNWRLIMAPISLVDYVIAHEVCHLREHNHSRRFWRLLEVIMPDYEHRARELSKMGHMFIW